MSQWMGSVCTQVGLPLRLSLDHETTTGFAVCLSKPLRIARGSGRKVECPAIGSLAMLLSRTLCLSAQSPCPPGLTYQLYLLRLFCRLQMTCCFQLWYISPGCPPLLPTQPKFNSSLLGSGSRLLASAPEDPGHPDLSLLAREALTASTVPFGIQWPNRRSPGERTRSHTTSSLSPFPSPTVC